MRKQSNQTDPFNAEDPVLPGMSAQPEESSDSAPQRTTSRSNESHRQSHATQQRTASHQRNSGAPQNTPSQPSSSPARTAAIIGGFALIFVVISIFIFTTFTEITSQADAVKNVFPDNDSSDGSESALSLDAYTQTKSALSQQLKQQFNERAAKSTSGNDAALVAHLARDLDKSYWWYTDGETLANVGVDSTNLAAWVMSSVAIDTSSLELYSFPREHNETNWDCIAYYDMTSPDIDDILYRLQAYVSDIRNESESSNDSVPRPLTQSETTRITTYLETLKQSTSYEKHLRSVECTGTCNEDGSNPQVSIGDDAWNNAYDEMFTGLSDTSGYDAAHPATKGSQNTTTIVITEPTAQL